jgi:hypothetical protein
LLLAWLGLLEVALLPTLNPPAYSPVRRRQIVWNVELGSIRSVLGSRPSDFRVVFVEPTFSLAFGKSTASQSSGGTHVLIGRRKH